MLRISLFNPAVRPVVRYSDSVNAAIIAGLRAAGATADAVEAAPWTFATSGWSASGGGSRLRAITVSTASPILAEALARLRPADVKVSSVNGDIIDFSGASVVQELDPVLPGVDEMVFAFAGSNPFVVMKPKTGREKTVFFDTLDGIDLSAAFSAGLSRRAGRPVRLDVSVDRLTVSTEGTRRIVRLRKARSRDIFVPGFALPVTVRGADDDIRFAYFAGVGSKCHAGFGCVVAIR